MNPKKWENEIDKVIASLDKRTLKIRVGEEDLEVVAATTEASRSRGLNGLVSLPKDGMIFIYQEDTSKPYSRADMQFDIAIHFFDADGKLVHSDLDSEIVQADNWYRYVLETSEELTGQLEIVSISD